MAISHASRLTPIALLALAALCAAAELRAQTTTQTTTTTIQYNADGAPTAVTTQVNDQSATTVYLTWDNFTPNAAMPSTGTVSAADGNLIGIGPTPGSSAATQQFGYDVRDRLTTCAPSGQPQVSYTYYPNNLMSSSTLSSGDALQFYYDAAQLPMMSNVSQPSTSLVSSFLGDVRYLSDGTEQVMLTPRKDTVGVYDADAQSLQSYSYDPYGAPADGMSSASDSYDLATNPYQYAGEYLDPICNAYYLRARWYLPQQQTFLSRDPVDLLHRYSYSVGDPIGRTDPSGLKSAGAAFSADIGRLVHRLTPGVWAYIEPVLPVWGQALGGIELLGDLAGFWHHRSWQSAVELGFLSGGVAAEVVGEMPWVDGAFTSPAAAMRARRGVDLALGGGQTFVQSYSHGRFDPPALIQGIETTFAGLAWGREIGGVGYRPFGLTMDDVDRTTSSFYSDADNAGNALIFRVRYNEFGAFTSPVMEQLHVGFYHEAILTVSNDTVMKADVTMSDDRYRWQTRWSRNADEVAQPSKFLAGKTSKSLIFSGVTHREAVQVQIAQEFEARYQQEIADLKAGTVSKPMDRPYRLFTNNCQHNAARVRDNIMNFRVRVHAGSEVDDLNAPDPLN